MRKNRGNISKRTEGFNSSQAGKTKDSIIIWIYRLLFAFVIIAVFPTDAQATQTMIGNYNSNYTLTGNGADDMVAVANAQLGKTKAQLGYTEAWCADFISDCAKLAGTSQLIPANGYCGSLYSNIKNAGGNEVTSPQKGDIVFYYCTASSCPNSGKPWVHVGLMVDSVNSIEGNYSGKVSSVNGHYRDTNNHTTDSGIIIKKYLRPNYSSPPPPTPDDTTPPTFNNVWIDPHNHTEIMLKANVSDNVGFREVRAYYKKSGNSEWHSDPMVNQGNGEWWICLNAVDGYGLYDIHIYAIDTSGNQSTHVLQTGLDNDIPSFDDLWIDPHNHTELMLKAKVSDISGINNVRAYYKKKSKTEWHSEPMVHQGNGEWWVCLNAIDGMGEYDIHVYAYDNANHVKGYPMSTQFDLDEKAKSVGRTIADGDYHIVSALDDTKVLTVKNQSLVSGANIQLWSAAEEEEQVFHVRYLGDGYYEIINNHSGMSLDVTDAEATPGTNLQQYHCNDSDAQKWIIKETGNGKYYNIISKCNGLNIDVVDGHTENGTNIITYTGHDGDMQKWRFLAWSKDTDKTIDSGDYHVINASDKTKSLDLYEYNPANRTPIGICTSATNKRQVFSVNYIGKGYYTIQHREAETAVETYARMAYKGMKVESYEYNGGQSQQWIIRKSPNSPYYNIVSKCGGFSINGDTSKPDHFVNATLEIGDGSPTQDWLFIPDEDQKLKAVTKDLNAALTWNALSWADAYDLNIKDSSGKDFSQKGLTDTTFTDQLPAGTYTASVTSRSDVYTLDSDEITFTTKRSAEDTVIEDITFEGKTYTYDGTPKSLAITQALPEGVSVKYSGNDRTDAGTYTVTAQFTDSTGKVMDVKSADLVIDPKDVSIEDSGVAVEQIPDQTYTGRETIQEPVVKDGEAVLQKDTDYTVSCEDNINVGEATATITFKGNYSGTKSLGFHINKAANSWKSALSCQDVVYGTGLKPAAEAAFGKTTYQFAKKADGTYSDQMPATAGTWYIKALVEGTDNYSGLVSDPVEVKITKAVYDLDGLNFEDKTVTYDGEPKSLTVKGQLPLGLTVAYDGNGEAEAGTYTITAHFEGDSNNYQPAPDMTATLTIEPRPVPIPEGYNDLVYNGEEQYGIWESEDYTVVSGGTATEAGTHEATVRLADKKNTAWEDGTTEDKKVSWTIAGAGNEWTEALTCPDITYGQAPSPSAKAKHGTVTFTYSRDDAMTFTGKVPTEAGTYYVRARVRETEEYAGLENIMEFTIKKASYDMANVSFKDSSVDYDGRQKSITVKGDLPEGLAVSYEGNGRYNAGSYEVKAKFTGDDNHEPVPAKTATLTILPKKAEDLTFGQIADRTYSGREMEPEVDVENDYVPLTKGFDYEVEYQDNKEAGAAKAVVTMKGNYEGTKEIPFTIRQAKNKWKTELTCPDIPYGTRPEPAAEARFGKVKFIYSDQEDGDYTDTLPGRFGTWFVKATVEETSNYTGLESGPFQFAIKKHTHVWDKGEVTREPTCTEAGVRTFTCGDCGDTKTEPIAAKGHKEVTDPAVAATRTSTGLTEGSHCSVCGAVIKKQSVIPKLGNGNTGGNTGSAGNGQGGPANPSGGGNNGGGTPGNQKAGPSGGSQGSGIQPALVEQEKAITSQKGDGDPKGSTYRSLSARVKKSSGNSNTLGWKKVSGATGYIVYGNQCGAKYRFKKLSELKGTSWTHKQLNGKKLKKGTYYKYIVVAVKDASGNKTVLATSKTVHAATAGGKAGNPGKLSVKKTTITLKRNKTSVIRVSQKPLSKKHKIRKCRKVCFESDNPEIATVTASGKAKGLKKGNCKIYVYAQNGLCKVVKVRVN